MTDISCAVCAEPWDSYGARHGDMRKWEYELFRKGAGCPSCEGDQPEGIDADAVAEEHIRDAWLRGGTDDPDSFTFGFDALDGRERPKWEPPQPRILWTCAGCEVSVGYVFDDEYTAEDEPVWIGGKAIHYAYGYARPYGEHRAHDDASDWLEPEYKLGDDAYCPGCAATCQGFDDGPDGCDAVILLLEDVDTYAPGSRFPDVLAGSPFRAGPGYCSDCFERIPSCGDCGTHYEEHNDAELCCAEECSAQGCWNKIDPELEDRDDPDGLCPDCREDADEEQEDADEEQEEETDE